MTRNIYLTILLVGGIYWWNYLLVISGPIHKNQTSSNWLGKAYVISTKLRLPNDLTTSAQACGFRPQIFPALLPYAEVYNTSHETIYKECFNSSCPYNKSSIKSIHLGELSLICSHLAAFKAIVSDPTVYQSEWTLIMEDDAVLHPSLTPRLEKQLKTASNLSTKGDLCKRD